MFSAGIPLSRPTAKGWILFFPRPGLPRRIKSSIVATGSPTYVSACAATGLDYFLVDDRLLPMVTRVAVMDAAETATNPNVRKERAKED